jgi:ParB/RepB/Spo0J family partition protein
MAVEFEVTGSRTSEYRFLPENLEIHPELNGQLQPVTIRRSDKKPVLVAGFSRWRAVSEINKRKLTEKPIELRCSYTQLNDRQAFLANIEENRMRNSTTPMDDAYNLQRLINVHQLTEQECADAYRASVAWVKGRLALIEATPEVEAQIRAGKIKGPAAKAVAKLSKEHQVKLAQLAAEKGKLTPADIQKETGKAPAQKADTPKASVNLLEMADKPAQMVVDEDQSIDKVIAAARAYLNARGV